MISINDTSLRQNDVIDVGLLTLEKHGDSWIGFLDEPLAFDLCKSVYLNDSFKKDFTALERNFFTKLIDTLSEYGIKSTKKCSIFQT